MDDDPLATHVLEPFSLIMIYAKCYYCGSDNYQDTRVGYNFGIRHCPDHLDWARRDCNAYLYSINRFRMEDAVKFPALKRLVTSLKNPTSIIRSNGDCETDWVIHDISEGHIDDFIYFAKIDGIWSVPMKKISVDIYKQVSIEGLTMNTHIPIDMVKEALLILDAEHYKDYYSIYKSLKKYAHSSEIPETAGVSTIEVEGRPCRIYLP